MIERDTVRLILAKEDLKDKPFNALTENTINAYRDALTDAVNNILCGFTTSEKVIEEFYEDQKVDLIKEVLSDYVDLVTVINDRNPSDYEVELTNEDFSEFSVEVEGKYNLNNLWKLLLNEELIVCYNEDGDYLLYKKIAIPNSTPLVEI